MTNGRIAFWTWVGVVLMLYPRYEGGFEAVEEVLDVHGGLALGLDPKQADGDVAALDRKFCLVLWTA